MKTVFYRKRKAYPISSGWEEEITRDPEWVYCNKNCFSAEKVTEEGLIEYEIGILGNKKEIEIQILFEKEI